ncbi:MAG: hypothetical protein JXR95_00305 [Deltaproteobacteria bacterium]|nr:hypothetical protein [Deltaproteobacteria bacterium]
MRNTPVLLTVLLSIVILNTVASCDDDTENASSLVSIKNDFNNPEMTYQPPWTICESWYLGQEFGSIDIGETSEGFDIKPGMGYVLMVAAWEDPECNPENCLPIASRNEEEVVDGQERIISINMPNHQGPCPPEGVAPIPEELYEQIRELWPEYDFLPYDQRTENTQCLE